MKPDVVTIGRILVDIYPEQDGPLENVSTFRQFVGGSPTNVAVAAARLGRRTRVVGSVGDDAFGRVAVSRLEELGVETDGIRIVAGEQTPVAFCEMVGEDAQAMIYRPTASADRRLMLDSAAERSAADAGVLWTSGSSLAVQDGPDAIERARAATSGVVVLDLDYRPAYWQSSHDARRALRSAIVDSHVVVGNLAECTIAVDASTPEEAARAIIELGADLAVVKMGERGVLAATPESSWFEPASAITARNGLGAGDAFGGALCHGLLSGWDIPEMLRFAGAAGAIVASRRECSSAMPTHREVVEFLERTAHAA